MSLNRAFMKFACLLPASVLTLAIPASAHDEGQIASIPMGSGDYPATFLTFPSLPGQVVYMPRDLTSLEDEKLAIYAFGNGGCSADGTSAGYHLLEIASHGYIAIAPGVIPGPLRDVPAPRELPNGQLSADTPSSALKDAIDWAIAQNTMEGSPLNGLVATDQIAVSGWSCGGLQALENAADPRIGTTVVMMSGIFNDEGEHISGIKARKSMLDDVHGSILYVLGGETDMAQPNGLDDYRRLNHLPAAVVDIPVGHGGTFHEENGGTGSEVTVAWLDWKLKGNQEAAAKFDGADCGFCYDDRFELMRKNFD